MEVPLKLQNLKFACVKVHKAEEQNEKKSPSLSKIVIYTAANDQKSILRRGWSWALSL